DHPPEARQRPIVSTTSLPSGMTPAQIDEIVRARVAAGEDLYTLDEGALRASAPDLIVTQDLCAVCAIDSDSVDDALVHLGCQAEVLTLDPLSFTDVLHTIMAVGAATGRASAGTLGVEEVHHRLGRVREAVSTQRRPRVALLEWTDPPYCPGHWVPDMIELAGATSALGRAGERSHPVAWPDLASSAPDAIVIAPCGF